MTHHQKDRLYSVGFMTSDLPDVGLMNADVLRRIFRALQPRILENDRALAAAGINRHGYDHQRRVARATLELGQRIPEIAADQSILQAATVGTTVHDVGYAFPQDWNHESITRFGKEAHAAHADNGAKVFDDTFQQLRKDTAKHLRFAAWSEQHLAVAKDAIRFHSNYSSVDEGNILSNEQIHPASLLPRAIDKLDMFDRVYPEHMEAIAVAASARNVAAVRRWMNDRSRLCLAEEHTPKRKKLRDLHEVRAKVGECDARMEHRFAPAAIKEQQMWYASDGSLHVRYTVYPQEVASRLYTTYTSSDHEGDFLKAYAATSLPQAALVMEALRLRLERLHLPDSAPLQVSLYYPGDEQERHFAIDSKGIRSSITVAASAKRA